MRPEVKKNIKCTLFIFLFLGGEAGLEGGDEMEREWDG